MITRTIIGNEIARQMAKSQSLGQEVVASVFAQIIAALANGEEVLVKDFGTFSVRHLPAREGRNPFNGEKIAIAASVGVTFRPYKALKAALNPEPMRMVGPDRGRTESRRRA